AGDVAGVEGAGAGDAGGLEGAGAGAGDLAGLERAWLDALALAATLDELREAELLVLGRRSSLARANQALGGLAAEERRARGAAVNGVRARLEAATAARRAELEAAGRSARLQGERLDLTEVLPVPGPGHLHLVTQARDELEDVFVGMGFTVAEGPEVETDWYNFQALNYPPAHPARAAQDSFYLRLGEPESVVLRTHTSPMQIRVMQGSELPIYAVMPGRCYRRETADARHRPTFHQIEALVVDRGITFGDLAGTIEAFTAAYFGPEVYARLRPGAFPFTEPSGEFEITCTICAGKGCRTCSGTGWVELGGCGMVDPAVFANVGIDSEEWSGFAFGFGIDRLAQMRHGLSDMRVLQDNDIRFLAQF
ncbi:MAG: phenylalanine--tRNA ligase subunit alpha, partial [Acidimicrobiales bacterium]